MNLVPSIPFIDLAIGKKIEIDSYFMRRKDTIRHRLRSPPSYWKNPLRFAWWRITTRQGSLELQRWKPVPGDERVGDGSSEESKEAEEDGEVVGDVFLIMIASKHPH